jgi:anti-sigma factor RsiW
MNCEEVQKLLHPYLDGELTPDEMASVTDALDGCPECQTELRELEAARLLTRAAFEGPTEEADFSNLFGGVMARLEAEGALRTTHSAPTPAVARNSENLAEAVWRCFRNSLSGYMPLASVLALALIASGIWWWQKDVTTERSNVVDVAATAPSKTVTPHETTSMPRRGMEVEVGRHAAFVEHYEATKGRVVIDENKSDPNIPMVVWHHVDEDATEIPDTEL